MLKKIITTTLILTLLFFQNIFAQSRISQQELDIGNKLIAQNKIQRAYIYFKMLDKKFPKDPIIKNNLAVILAKLGKLDSAINMLQEAIDIDMVTRSNYQNLKALYDHKASIAYKQILFEESNTLPLPELAIISQSQQQPEKTIIIEAKKKTEEAEINKQDIKNAIYRALDHWRQSWSEQNADEYIKSYQDNYKSAQFRSHNDWKRIRIKRIKKPNFIRLKISNLKFLSISENSVTVKFNQDYQSDSYQDSVEKVLIFKKLNNEWKISFEENL